MHIKNKLIGLDIETAKKPNHFPWKDRFYLSVVSISYPDDTAKSWVFHHNEVDDEDFIIKFDKIQREVDKYDYVAIHNAKFDVNVLRSNIQFKKLWCTQVAEYLLQYMDRRGLKLNDLCAKYGLPSKLDKVKIMWDAGYDTHEVPLSTLTEYCEDDATKHRKIALLQYDLLRQRGLMKCFNLQMEWLDMLSEMEVNGILWDNKHAQKILDKYTRYSSVLDSCIRNILRPHITYVDDMVLNSNDDLSVILYGGSFKRKERVSYLSTKNVKVQMPYIFTYKDGRKVIKTKWNDHKDTKVIRTKWGDVYYDIPGLGIKPLPKTETKKSTKERPFYRTDKDTLPLLLTTTPLQTKIIKLILKKAKIDKVISTFYSDTKSSGLMNKVAKDGRLHTNYNQTIVATGRLSSSDPNSQNMPRGGTSPVKTCIIPEFDGIMNGDISQIELRVPAELAQDKVMMNEFKTGEDLHDNARKDVLKIPKTGTNRVHAKVLNFRMIYGGTEWGFFKDPDMPAFKIGRWKEIIRAWYNKYNGIEKWQNDNIKHVINGDGTLQLFTGRTFKFKLGPFDKYNEREIKNYPVQGTAGGDLLPLAAVIIRKGMKTRGMKSKPILTVHDSIVFDYVESEKDELARLVKKVFKDLPKYIKMYWGYNWTVPITGDIEIGENYGSLKKYL